VSLLTQKVNGIIILILMKYIYTKACRRINILRMMKHKLDRKSLEQLYIGFIRPILEYGGIVWDNCSLHVHESEILESV
jgi:hypothetical protein